MTLKALIKLISKLFTKLKIRYFTYGAVGMGLWIEGRATKDLDIVIFLESKNIMMLVHELKKIGFKITKSLERILREGRVIRLPLSMTELDIKLCRTSHDKAALDRAQIAQYESLKLSVATPEDIILYKLQSWRRIDQADIERLKHEISDLDLKYIESWLDLLGDETGQPLRKRWESI